MKNAKDKLAEAGWIGFNLNHCVKVKLTDKGRQVYEDFWRQDGIKPLPLNVDTDGFVKFEAWWLMSIFGSSLSQGLDVPFETTIYINSDNLNLHEKAGQQIER